MREQNYTEPLLAQLDWYGRLPADKVLHMTRDEYIEYKKLKEQGIKILPHALKKRIVNAVQVSQAKGTGKQGTEIQYFQGPRFSAAVTSMLVDQSDPRDSAYPAREGWHWNKIYPARTNHWIDWRYCQDSKVWYDKGKQGTIDMWIEDGYVKFKSDSRHIKSWQITPSHVEIHV